MAELKTKPTSVSVKSFLDKVADPQSRADAYVIMKMMQEITGFEPRMWGPSIVGFGEYHYKYASGHEGDCCVIGFSPRKGQHSLYFMPGLHRFRAHLKKLGKHKTGKACLYIKKLADVDVNVLREMIEIAIKEMCVIQTQMKEKIAAKKKVKK